MLQMNDKKLRDLLGPDFDEKNFDELIKRYAEALEKRKAEQNNKGTKLPDFQDLLNEKIKQILGETGKSGNDLVKQLIEAKSLRSMLKSSKKAPHTPKATEGEGGTVPGSTGVDEPSSTLPSGRGTSEMVEAKGLTFGKTPSFDQGSKRSVTLTDQDVKSTSGLFYGLADTVKYVLLLCR